MTSRLCDLHVIRDIDPKPSRGGAVSSTPISRLASAFRTERSPFGPCCQNSRNRSTENRESKKRRKKVLRKKNLKSEINKVEEETVLYMHNKVL